MSHDHIFCENISFHSSFITKNVLKMSICLNFKVKKQNEVIHLHFWYMYVIFLLTRLSTFLGGVINYKTA